MLLIWLSAHVLSHMYDEMHVSKCMCQEKTLNLNVQLRPCDVTVMIKTFQEPPFASILYWLILKYCKLLKRHTDNPILYQYFSLQWRQNGRDSVSHHQPQDCLLSRLFRRRSKKTSKLRVTGLYVGNSPMTGEFPAQMTSNAENVSIWWRHHGAIRLVSALPVQLWCSCCYVAAF